MLLASREVSSLDADHCRPPIQVTTMCMLAMVQCRKECPGHLLPEQSRQPSPSNESLERPTVLLDAGSQVERAASFLHHRRSQHCRERASWPRCPWSKQVTETGVQTRHVNLRPPSTYRPEQPVWAAATIERKCHGRRGTVSRLAEHIQIATCCIGTSEIGVDVAQTTSEF